MEETQKFLEPTPVDRDATFVAEPDETLVTPRFDEVEAQVARPVVPFAAGGGGAVVKRARRQWPIALVLISALAGGVVSLFAFRLYQQQQSRVAATETGNQQTTNIEPTPEPTPVAESATAVTEVQAQTESPLIFEEFDPAKEGVEITDAGGPVRNAEDARPAAARRDERKDEAKPAAAAPRAAETSPRRAESGSPAPRQVEARHEDARRSDDRADEDISAERRERRRERREQRREQRRAPRRNIDRIKDIFEGAPPA